MSMNRRIILPSRGGAPDARNGSIFFIGTATVIIRYAGYTILTDPNFLHRGEKVRLGYGLRSTRLTNPALEIDELPPLDLVVLSHMHEDHFDRVAEEKLDRSVPVVTTRHAAIALRKIGFSKALGLQTWKSVRFVKDGVQLSITSMPGRHGPGPLSALLPPVMGSMLEFAPASGGNGQAAMRLYITGDTLVHEDLEDIPSLFPDIDLALLHLGGTRALGLMVTMDGKQGVKVLQIVAPTMAIPIHYNDYTVFKSPLSDFEEEVRAAGLQDRVHYLRHGESYNFSAPLDRETGHLPADAGAHEAQASEWAAPSIGSDNTPPGVSAE